MYVDIKEKNMINVLKKNNKKRIISILLLILFFAYDLLFICPIIVHLIIGNGLTYPPIRIVNIYCECSIAIFILILKWFIVKKSEIYKKVFKTILIASLVIYVPYYLLLYGEYIVVELEVSYSNEYSISENEKLIAKGHGGKIYQDRTELTDPVVIVYRRYFLPNIYCENDIYVIYYNYRDDDTMETIKECDKSLKENVNSSCYYCIDNECNHRELKLDDFYKRIENKDIGICGGKILKENIYSNKNGFVIK